jgi:hypothetical protein
LQPYKIAQVAVPYVTLAYKRMERIDNLWQTLLEFATEDLQFRILAAILGSRTIHGDKPQ